MQAAIERGTADRFVILTWCCLAAMVAYLQRTAIGVASGAIREDLGFSVVEFGFVMSGYYWTYALSQLPAGWVGQQIGARGMLIVCVAGSSAMTMIAGLCPSRLAFALAWLSVGIAIAGIFPSCVQLFVAAFAPTTRAFPSGMLSSSMSIGGAISTTLTGMLLASTVITGGVSWRAIFIAYGAIGLVWAIGYGWWSRPVAPPAILEHDQPAAVLLETNAEVPTLRLSDVLLDVRTWLICGQQFFRAAGYVFYATWFPEFLRMTREVNTASAGQLTSLPLLGVVLGGAMGGVLADTVEHVTGSRRVSRQVLGIGSHGVCALLIFAAQFIADPTTATLVISLGSFVFALGTSSAYAITMDLGGPHTSTLFGLMNMCGNIGAALCPMVVGLLVTALGWGPILYFFAALYFAAAVCWLGLNPNRSVTS